MGDIDGDGEGSRVKFMVKCSVRCAETIHLWLESVSSSDVRARAILNFKVMVKHG